MTRIHAAPLRHFVWLAIAFAGVGSASCGGGDAPTQTAVGSIALNTPSLSLNGVGAEGSLAATLNPSGSTAAVTWRSENTTIVTVTANGRNATVRAIAGGTARVFASVGAIEGSTTITVVPIARSLTVSPPTASLVVGATQPLQAVLTADAGVSTTLQWISSAATVVSVSSDGVITGVSPGSATVTVSSTAFPSVTAQMTVSVSLPAVSLSVAPTTPAIVVGGNTQLTPTVTAATGVSQAVTWMSGTPAVATVNAAGLVTALTPGSAVITATSVANPTVSASSTVTVSLPRVTAISMSLASAMTVGDVAQATMTVTADPGADVTLDYTSTSSAIASVSSAGVVTAVATGTATITASSRTLPKVSAARMLTVNAPTYPMQWTGSRDAVIGPAAAQGNFSSSAMLSDGTLILVGTGGMIAERSPAGVWTRAQSPTTSDLNAAVAVGGTVWVTGKNGVVLQRGIAGWALENTGVTVSLASIAMRSDGSGLVSAVNNQVMLERTAAGVWQPIVAPEPAGFVAPQVAVSEDGGKYVTGIASFSFYRWFGGAWQGIVGRIGDGQYNQNMLVLGPNDLLMSGSQPNLGYISRWNNGVWTREYTDPGPSILDRSPVPLWRCIDGTVIGGINFSDMLIRVGTTWQPRVAPGSVRIVNSKATCMTPNEIFQIRGDWVRRVTGSTVNTELLQPSLSRLGFGGGMLAFASESPASSGYAEVALRYNGTTWTAFPMPPSTPFNANNNGPAFAVFDNNSALAVANGYTGSWNGTNFDWSSISNPALGLWGASANDVWAAGAQSSTNVWRGLQRGQGATWTAVEPLMSTALGSWRDVRGANANAVFVVGDNGVVGHWNGTTFTRDPLPSVVPVSDIAVFSGTSAITFSGNRIFVWNGTAWTERTIPGRANVALTAIAGRSENEFYVFNASTELYGCSLQRCTLIQVLPDIVRKARIVGDKGLAVGDNGLVVYGTLKP